MTQTAKILLGIVILALVVWGVVSLSKSQPTQGEPMKVGAILPLTGPAAIWGEPLQKGITLAQEELSKEGISIEIIYEDSRAEPAAGISAYNKLVDIDGVDIIYSGFSRVSVPLLPLADEDKVPLIMTFVSANGVTDASPYAFRLFTQANQYVDPHFAVIDPKKYDKIAILYVNDEYGVSVRDVIRQKAQEKNITVVSKEAFTANTSDFRTHLTKIKGSGAKAIMFVGVTPTEISAAINQSQELAPEIDFFEESVLLSTASIRNIVGKNVEEIFTNAFSFTLEKTGRAFRNAYRQKYNEEPIFAAALSYDAVKLVARATKGQKLSGEEVAQKIVDLKRFEGANGTLEITSNREINPELFAVQIVNNNLVEIK